MYKHLLKDPAFEEGFGRAVRLGYLRLEARMMQEAHRPGALSNGAGPSTIGSSANGPPPPDKLGEDYEVRILDDGLAGEQFDPQLALHLLREHKRHLPGSTVGRKSGAAPRAADAREIADALARRLKGFALRHGSGPALRVEPKTAVRAEPVEALPSPFQEQGSPSTGSGRTDR